MQRSIAVLSFPPESFNPHPSRRTGATCPPRRALRRPGSFNPHPSRRTGATGKRFGIACIHAEVSILTRPGGRVQLVTDTLIQPVPYRFNPHPSRRTGATRMNGCTTRWQKAEFQSSPVPEDGCNARYIPE